MNNKFFKPVMAIFAVAVFSFSAMAFANPSKEVKISNMEVKVVENKGGGKDKIRKEWVFVSSDYVYKGTER